jgi:hypothetical protein
LPLRAPCRTVRRMPKVHPIAASGTRELKRPRRIPANVRDAIRLMVYGRPDDADMAPIGFIEAAKDCGIAPDHMRKYLDRADVRALLLSERRTFRTTICGSNELALLRVRDTAANSMAVVASVRALEELEDERAVTARGGVTPGFVILIAVPPGETPRPAHAAPGFVIEHAPIERSPSPVDQA